MQPIGPGTIIEGHGVLKKMAARIARRTLPVGPRLGRALGRIAWGLDIRHRRIVLQNLELIYPALDRRRRRGMARSVFEHFGIVAVEILQAPFMTRREMAERVTIDGLETLAAAMADPRGCLLYSAHLGNWELGFLALSARLDRPILTVAKPIKLRFAHDWLTALRSRFGSRVVFKEGAMPYMTRALRGGRTLAVLIDQGVRRSEAVEVSFLGQRTMATPAAALLALRCRMPVVPLFCLRQPGDRYLLKIMPPVRFERTASLRHDLQAGTQALMRSLEGPIRDHPGQWFWFHKRWKRTHPDLYPEYRALRRRRRRRKGLPV